MSKKAPKVVQSVTVKKKYAPNLETAISWVAAHHLTTRDVDETENTYRFRQHDPSFFRKGSYSTYHIGHGIMATVATPKDWRLFQGLPLQEIQ